MKASIGLLAQSSFSGFWSLIWNTGLIGQLILLLLLLFSVFSWAIMVRKWRLFREVRHQSLRFHQEFEAAQSLSGIYQQCERFPLSPLAGVFKGGYLELERQIDDRDGEQKLNSLAGVERSLRRAAQAEMTELEKSLSWLATTGSVTPFIGLLGTVIGIINAFQGLGEGATTTIQAVAPGISEALVATAAGLFAAIPAVIGYNQFVSELKVFAAELDDFSAELLNLVERSFG